jgi:hypothetical protein
MYSQTESGQSSLWLKTAIVAAAAMVFLTIFAAQAKAEPVAPLAPEITTKPSDPNTAPSATFAFQKAAGDPATVNAYQCRQYLTASPPASPSSGWINCALVDAGGTYTYAALANGSQTFEIRAVGSTESANLVSPTSSYVWLQDAPAPVEEPDLTATPTDPNTSATATFEFAVDDAETVPVTGFQCRRYLTSAPPATPETGWATCGTETGGTVSYTDIPNGPNTFEIRSRSGLISGPVGTFEWEQAVPAPSSAPDITAKPTNPNLLNTVSFSYAKSSSETNAVTSFQCRQYAVSNPPAGAETGWSACGTGETGTKAYPNLANDNYKFDVRARNGLETGPVASYTWTQAFPLPAVGPKITSSPAEVETSTTAFAFAFTKGDGETATVDRFQCRFTAEGSTPPNWSNCNGGSYKAPTNIKNGEFTFDVRAGNQGGYGQATSYTFELAFPDPAVKVSLDDAVTTKWVGTAASANLGDTGLLTPPGLSVAGDVNGDGLNDIVATSNTGSQVHVFFSDPGKKGTRSTDELKSDDGYRIVAPNYSRVSMIGDQNDDGNADIMLAQNSPNSFKIIYGIADPSALPECPGSEVRCLDTNLMTSDQGYTIALSGDLQYAGDLFGSAGDFDGDGVDDLVIGDGQANNRVIKGGERSGTVDPGTLGPDQVFSFTSADAFMNFSGTASVGDLNGDGRDEIAGMGNPLGGPGGMKVIYGRTFSAENPDPLDVDTMPNTDGFSAATPPFSLPLLNNIGDVNGDGRPDLMLGSVSLAPALSGGALGGESSIIYTPEAPFDYIVGSADLEPEQGYWVDGQSAQAGLGLAADSISDLNGDGLTDTLLGAMGTPNDGASPAGAVYAMFTHHEPGGDPVELGGALTPDQGVAITADSVGTGFGIVVRNMGDLDGDGLGDFAAAASTENAPGLSQAGAVYIVYGKSFMPRTNTGKAFNVADKSATLSGIAGTNKGDSTVKFQYGTTDQYGAETSEQTVAGSNRSESVDADLSGLEPDTGYHYRLVVTNGQGVTRLGADRTFTTAKTPPPEGCEADSTLPGCKDYDRCATDTTQPGCKDYDYCKENAGKPECQAPQAKLSGLIVSVAQSKVKRGKKTTAKATIVNTGTAAADGTKICLTAPKKMIGGAKCVNVGSLGAGASKTVKFKVKVKKKAKKGKKVALKFKSSANGLGSKTGKVKIKVG